MKKNLHTLLKECLTEAHSPEELAKRYEQYNQFDDEEAWNHFRQQHFPSSRTRIMKRLLQTAAVILFLAGITLLYRQLTDTTSTTSQKLLVNNEQTVQPQTAIEKAIQQSMSQGKNEATLVISGSNKRVRVNSNEKLQTAEKAIESEHDFDAKYELVTETGKEFWMFLDDGTRIHLNNGTRLKYPMHFDQHDRTVYLDGEAYFEVAHDASRPFRVVTDHGIISDYGTAFNVNTQDKKGSTQVVLVEGRVGVTPIGGKEHMMRPGQKCTLTAGICTTEHIDVEPYIAWNTGRYVFNDCPMEQLMQVLGRWYGKRVFFANDAARHILFNGSIDRYQSASPALGAIRYATGLSIIETERTIIINN